MNENDNKPLTRAELKKQQGNLFAGQEKDNQQVFKQGMPLQSKNPNIGEVPHSVESRKKARGEFAANPVTSSLPRAEVSMPSNEAASQTDISSAATAVMPQQPASGKNPQVLNASDMKDSDLHEVSASQNKASFEKDAASGAQEAGSQTKKVHRVQGTATEISDSWAKELSEQPLSTVLAHNPYSKDFGKTPEVASNQAATGQIAIDQATAQMPTVGTDFAQPPVPKKVTNSSFHDIAAPGQKAPVVQNTEEIIDTKHLEKTLQKVSTHQVETAKKAKERKNSELESSEKVTPTAWIALGVGSIAFVLGLVAFVRSFFGH